VSHSARMASASPQGEGIGRSACGTRRSNHCFSAVLGEQFRPPDPAALLLRLAVEDNAAMQTEPTKADPPKRKRRWFQFSLRTLMIGVTLLVEYYD
jgi:hypothetical protein